MSANKSSFHVACIRAIVTAAVILSAVMLLMLTACARITGYIGTQGGAYTITYITTPRGSNIEAITTTSALTAAKTAEINNSINQLITTSGWAAVMLSGPSLSYNCHSFAWHDMSPNNQYWINQTTSTGAPNLSHYWTDGSFQLIATVANGSIPTAVLPMTRAFYVNGDHSAVVVSNVDFVSKWGRAGVYQHRPMHAPYTNVLNIQYYTASQIYP